MSITLVKRPKFKTMSLAEIDLQNCVSYPRFACFTKRALVVVWDWVKRFLTLFCFVYYSGFFPTSEEFDYRLIKQWREAWNPMYIRTNRFSQMAAASVTSMCYSCKTINRKKEHSSINKKQKSSQCFNQWCIIVAWRHKTVFFCDLQRPNFVAQRDRKRVFHNMQKRWEAIVPQKIPLVYQKNQ